MTETSNTAASAAGSAGANGNESFNREKEMAEYEKEKQAVKELLQRRNQLSRNILGTDNRIADMETKYLDSTPVGNILTGFDNYTKGVTATSAQRRKVGAIEQNRVFSRSSISYNPNNVPSRRYALWCFDPRGPHARLDVVRPQGEERRFGCPHARLGHREEGRRQKKKAAAAAAAAAAEDSETDSREVKKVRTQFGAARK
ncbi:NuA4-domain-containing protein [Apiospora hydei]|uniref:Chromatin modification-related protein EAF6 n=1 Tax=Apiospora hydei TaxID=1337664 RepID=A0ABR1X2K6_9PEZI